MMDMLEKAQRMLEKYPLCSHCLGRQFALLGCGLDNLSRGEALKLSLTMRAHQQTLGKNKKGFTLLKTLASNGSFHMAAELLKRMNKKVNGKRSCHLCNGRFDSITDLVKCSVNQLQPLDYSTFLVGVELPIEVEEREDEFKAEFEVKHGESMRNAFSREIGKRIAEATRKTTDYKKPDVVVLLNPYEERLNIQVNPIYIAGRYRKLVRGIPQSRWLCSKCRGRGCERCNWTGKLYPESVEELIGEPIRQHAEGEAMALHGAGREDIDARMLGQGRPFVIEVKKPKKRFLNLRKLAKTINQKAHGKVSVSSLRFVSREWVRRLKGTEAAEKVYRAIVEFDRTVQNKELAQIKTRLVNTVIHQQTPRRVLHRRADLVREKHIYEAKVKRLTPNRIELRLKCQGGLYIKELITGDEGRTVPNIAEIIGARATTLELDVLNVLTNLKE